MNIKEFFPVCINLENRVDRWIDSQEEFHRVDLDKYVSRFVVIPNLNPIVGCAMSHFSVLEMCKDYDKHAMIFEDDIHFINNFLDISKYLEELDNMNWDILYFGANITTSIKRVSDKFARVKHAQSTHAYCVNKKFIPTILEKKYLVGKHMDLIYAEDIIPLGNVFITIPMLAIQRPSYSDIERKIVDYNWMEERFYSNLRKDN